MNKKYIWLVLIVIVAGLAIWLNSRNSPAGQEVEKVLTTSPADMPLVDPSAIADQGMGVEQTLSASTIKEFTVIGTNFAFAPTTMTVKKGDTVKIIFKNSGGFHDLKIDEFAVATKKLASGAEETIEFVADKAGSFEYYCSVGTHRQMGMKGTLIVQ
jgi:plastocyanin